MFLNVTIMVVWNSALGSRLMSSRITIPVPMRHWVLCGHDVLVVCAFPSAA